MSHGCRIATQKECAATEDVGHRVLRTTEVITDGERTAAHRDAGGCAGAESVSGSDFNCTRINSGATRTAAGGGEGHLAEAGLGDAETAKARDIVERTADG